MKKNTKGVRRGNSLKEFNKEDYEQWKYNDKYNLYVSTEGQVARKYTDFYVLKKQHIRKRNNKSSYCTVALHNKTLSVARLVWETFRYEVPKGYYVGHKNGCNTINELNNLYIMTQEEISIKGNLKKSYQVLDCDTGIVYKSVRELGEKLHVHPDTIRKSIRGVTKDSWVLLHKYKYIIED